LIFGHLYLFHPGALTINAAITRYASCVIETRRRRDKKVRLVSLDTNAKKVCFVRRDGEGEALQVCRCSRKLRNFSGRRRIHSDDGFRGSAGAGIGGSSAMAVAICAAVARFLPLERAKSIGFTSAATRKES